MDRAPNPVDVASNLPHRLRGFVRVGECVAIDQEQMPVRRARGVRAGRQYSGGDEVRLVAHGRALGRELSVGGLEAAPGPGCCWWGAWGRARGRGRGGGGNAAGAHCVLIEQPSSTESSSVDKTRTRIAPPSSFITSHTERGPAGGGEYDDERWARSRCAAPKLAVAVPSTEASEHCAPLSGRRGCSRAARGGLGGAPGGASLMRPR